MESVQGVVIQQPTVLQCERAKGCNRRVSDCLHLKRPGLSFVSSLTQLTWASLNVSSSWTRGYGAGYGARSRNVVCMVTPRRVKMVGQQIKREISTMLLHDKVLQQAVLPERGLGADMYLSSVATISDVEMSNDLSVAKVYISVFGDKQGKEQALEGLKAKAKYVRMCIGKRMSLKFTPEVRFIGDDSLERGSKVLALLDKIKEERRIREEGGPVLEQEDPEEYEEENEDEEEDEEVEETKEIDSVVKFSASTLYRETFPAFSLGKRVAEFNFNSNFVALFVSSALIAMGMGMSFSKPALAKILGSPQTVTATIDDKAEVSVEDRTGNVEGSRDAVSEETREEVADFAFQSEIDDPTEAVIKSFAADHPEDNKAIRALLFVRLKKGDLEGAVSVVNELIKREPDQIEWKLIRAQAYDYSGNLDQARQGFQELLEIHPLSARILQGLAVVMHKSGQDEQAVALLVSAVGKAVDANQEKEATNLRMLLGQIHTIQGNLEAALEQYQLVAEKDPGDFRPYLCQGLVYSIIGEQVEAEKQFRKYRKLCPKDFAHKGFLDHLMLKAKTESQRAQRQRVEERKGQKIRKPLRKPLAGPFSNEKPEQ